MEMEEGFAAVMEGSLVSIGEKHGCAIEVVEDAELGGEIVCWMAGRDKAGLLNTPDGIFVQISAGSRHNCAIRVDGTLVCWGRADWTHKAPAGSFLQVSSGTEHSCAVRKDGAVKCFGMCGIGQCKPPDGVYAQVSSAGHASCGLLINGTARCWGLGASGPHGFGITPRGVQFSQLTLSTSRTVCGVTANASMICWGSIVAHPDDGQILVRDGAYLMATAGSNLYCGLTAATSTISCEGDVFHLSRGAKHLPPKEATWGEITSRHSTICGIRMEAPHEVQCWGGEIAESMPEHAIHAPM
jgi:hypothetical protein